MKMTVRITMLALSAAGLAACAGSGAQKSTYVPPSHVGDYVVDSNYVGNVERIAQRQGIDVQWVNVPVRRVATSDEP